MPARPEALLRVEDGVAIVTLSNPPVNALHPDLLRSFKEKLQLAQADPAVKAIVIDGANGRFCAGFDINQFANADGNGLDLTVNDTLIKLVEDGPKPTVAAVAGLALGGGCEVAVAANARVGLKGVKVGLPELTLGILPGFGGTQRLPRLLGLEAGVQAILTSKPIKDTDALKAGLFTELVATPAELLPAAKRLALDIASGKVKRVRTLQYEGKLPSSKVEAEAILAFARKETAKKARNVQHPLLMLDAIKTGVLEGGLAGIRAEERAFEAATKLPAHRALVHVFFSSRATRKVAGVTDRGLKPRPVRKLAVVGGGLMGSGIVTASILVGIETILKEISQQFLDAGVGRIKTNLDSAVRRGRLTRAKADAALAKLRPTLTYDGWKDVDMVIEAAVERPDLKQKIFEELKAATGPDTILSTNTSTIDLNIVSDRIRGDASRVIGAHFFSPAHLMPLLEIIRTDKTDPQVILDTMTYGAKIGKTPVVVGNCAGFAVNRAFFPYNQAAQLLLDAGGDPYAIDSAIQSWGMPVGPFRLADLVGVDVAYHIAPSYLQAFPERIYRTAIINLLYDAKLLGEKTNAGFYTYDARRRATPNPDVQSYIAQSRERAALTPAQRAYAARVLADPEAIANFIFYPVVNESARIVSERIVDKPADLDVATILSMGFPSYRGGIIHWADHVGARKIRDSLNEAAAVFADKGIAGFFRPSKFLEDAANNGTKLSAGVASAKI